MAFVITRLCIDHVDTSCVAVCPVDCIYTYTGSDRERFPNQLYINPDQCIDCGACAPECPWEAIFDAPSVPEVFSADTALNALTTELADDFKVQGHENKTAPTPEEVAANKAKWGWSE